VRASVRVNERGVVLDCFYDKRVRGCCRGGTYDGIPLYAVNDDTSPIVLGQGHTTFVAAMQCHYAEFFCQIQDII
jgi:hypothetical protein